MSNRATRIPVWGHRRRKTTLNLDLNTEPPTDHSDRGGTSNLATSSQLEISVEWQAERPVSIDIEAVEDDVAVCSPTAFAEAKRKARMNRGRTGVVDVESDVLVVRLDPIIHKRRRGANATHQERESDLNFKLVLSLLPVPKEPIFSCPICMGPLVEETSTKCGHIFCKTCIIKAISGQTKCPTCRKKVVMKDLIRIFFPATLT